MCLNPVLRESYACGTTFGVRQTGKAGRQADRQAGRRTDRQAANSSQNITKKTRNSNRDDVKEFQIEGFGRKTTKASITCG